MYVQEIVGVISALNKLAQVLKTQSIKIAELEDEVVKSEIKSLEDELRVIEAERKVVEYKSKAESYDRLIIEESQLSALIEQVLTN